MAAEIVIEDGQSSDHVIDALRRGAIRVRFNTDSLEWREPVDPATLHSQRTLVFEGLGLERTNIVPKYDGPDACLFNHRDQFALRWRGINFNCVDGPRSIPFFVDFTYVDRGSWREVGFYGLGGRPFKLGGGPELLASPRWPAEGWGRVSQFHMNRVEAHRCAGGGGLLAGARAFSITGDSSFERCGTGPELTVEGDTRIPGFCGHGSIHDLRLERDDERVSLLLRGLAGMHVGGNRYVCGYMDAECDYTTWYGDVLKSGRTNRRVGSINTMIGRDLQLPYDSSGA